MACCFSLLEHVEPPVKFALSKQGAQRALVESYNKLSITILANPQIFSKNAKFKLTQKGLRIDSICQFQVNLSIILRYSQKESEILDFLLIKR